MLGWCPIRLGSNDWKTNLPSVQVDRESSWRGPFKGNERNGEK